MKLQSSILLLFTKLRLKYSYFHCHREYSIFMMKQEGDVPSIKSLLKLKKRYEAPTEEELPQNYRWVSYCRMYLHFFMHIHLSPTLQRQFPLYIPFLGIARPQPQFPHSCVFERFIHIQYSQDQSTYLQQNI
jgi:hypothetical protein